MEWNLHKIWHIVFCPQFIGCWLPVQLSQQQVFPLFVHEAVFKLSLASWYTQVGWSYELRTPGDSSKEHEQKLRVSTVIFIVFLCIPQIDTMLPVFWVCACIRVHCVWKRQGWVGGEREVECVWTEKGIFLCKPHGYRCWVWVHVT